MWTVQVFTAVLCIRFKPFIKKKRPDHCIYPLTMPMCKETHCKQFYLNCWKKRSKAWICEEKECLAPQTLFHEHKNKQISNI